MAQPACDATGSVGVNGNVVKVHQAFPKTSERRKVQRFRKEVAQVLGGVDVYCFDKLGVT